MDKVMSEHAMRDGRSWCGKDLSDPRLLREEAPLEMPEQDFNKRCAVKHDRGAQNYWIARAAIFTGAGLLTAAFAYELYNVLAFVRLTPIQFVFLLLSTVAFGWIALGSLSAAIGFIPLFAGEKADTIDLPGADGELHTRTALLFPVYHEDPARIAGTIAAMADELAALARAQHFDVFVLSDTRGQDAGSAEEAAYAELARGLSGTIRVYYRRRIENVARKAGNIKDWVERFGAAYEHFVILDADSVMSGRTLVRLALAMQGVAGAGLIQTAPRLTGGTTLLQRLQQFACNVYGPPVAAGLAFWHRDQGNYWGHNAIIRTVAFAGAAGLPALPGRPPFGGHIQSHDFVEAVLLQRAGWGVHMVPVVDGSYESMPPSLIDLVVRDRRWAQGNLQHLSIVRAAGITPMGRVHLVMGAFSYMVSAVWAASLAVGVVLALQGQQMIPSYFEDSKTLFPIWPVIDPGAALRLFLATMAVVLLPKAMGLALEVRRAVVGREEASDIARAVVAVLVETVFSMLLAPVLMITQTVAVFQIVSGIDTGWRPQRRDNGALAFEDAFRFHWRHTTVGLTLALICWWVTPELVAWMGPIILGLVLSAPMSWYIAQPAGPVLAWLLSTPEDRSPPAILTRAQSRTREWAELYASGLAVGSQEPVTDLQKAA